MNANNWRPAEQVQWIDPGGQRFLLDASNCDELNINIEQGAVTIFTDNCVLTEFGIPNVKPDIRRRVDKLRVTIPLSNCRIDWK